MVVPMTVLWCSSWFACVVPTILLWFPKNFLRLSYGIPIVFLLYPMVSMMFIWHSYDMHMICQCCSYDAYAVHMVVLWLSNDFHTIVLLYWYCRPMIVYDWPMIVIWYTYACPMKFLWLSYGFCSYDCPMIAYDVSMVCLWLSYDCPMIVLWCSYAFPMILLWWSYDVPMMFQCCMFPDSLLWFPMICLWCSYGFPMIVLCNSYGRPMIGLWYSYDIPVIFIWFANGFTWF